MRRLPIVLMVALLTTSLSGGASAYTRPRSTEVLTVPVEGVRLPDLEPIEHTGGPSISYSGRYVAFQSRLSDLAPRDLNQAADVFVRDRQRDTTELISATTLGLPALGE